uniref:Na_H_Exchanger domain-containing protein n=1 Tax=Hydatigena taeniaeformis TaxID=6205 RepID=A0A0R3X3X5_HYDTA
LHCEMTFFNEFFFFGVLFPPLAINAALEFKPIVKNGILPSTIVFGLLGSFFTFSLTALSLWTVHAWGAMGMQEYSIKPIAFILFSSLICSTDLAIVFGLLGKLKVHPFLYLIFVGESLINDGVSLSLFTMTNNAASSHLTCVEKLGVLPWFMLMILSFSLQLCISAIVGLLFGFMSSIVTRWTRHETTLEPVIVFCLCYTGYIITYIYSWPSTFYLIFFCIILSSFTFRNVSHKSVITIRHFAQMTSAIADSLIFLYVGFSIAAHDLSWQTGFIAWTTFFCIVWRFVFTFMASYLTNYFFWTRQKITIGMMFFISYGGFKGSVAHALVEIVSPETAKAMGIPLSILRCTVVFINLFYVIFIGLTMAPLLRIYKFLSSGTVRLSLFETLNNRVILSACNAVADVVGHQHSTLQSTLVRFYKRHLRPFLLRAPNEHDEITDVYADIALALHYASVAKDRHSVHFHLRRLRPQLKKAFYFQQRQQGVLKPFHHVSLHHIDLISDPTDMSITGQLDGPALPLQSQRRHSYTRPFEVSKDVPSSEDFATGETERSEDGGGTEVFYDAECEEAQNTDAVLPKELSSKESVKRKKNSCCGCDLILESSDSDTTSADEGGGDVRPSTNARSRDEEGLFRQLLSRHNQHTYAFDESAFAERVQQSIQSKHRALKFHYNQRI